MSKDDKESSDEEMDLTDSERGIWLVKIPKYLARKWDCAPSNMNVGKLRITKTPGLETKVSLSLTPEVEEVKSEEGNVKLPTDYILDVSDTKQTLGVFSTEANNVEQTSKEQSPSELQKLCMEGRIVKKGQCRPIAEDTYMKFKQESLRIASASQRRTQSLKAAMPIYKPIAHRDVKEEVCKNICADKSFVLEMLFNAFEKHQYYKTKDLVKITKQPMGYLKAILKEVCDYNIKNPHKNMWELKKEYQHYGSYDKKETKKPYSDSESE